MKRIPKTPVEFDYDLWTTEDGKCMVRVKITGEVTEVDREVMKILRLEEKQMRRGVPQATRMMQSPKLFSFLMLSTRKMWKDLHGLSTRTTTFRNPLLSVGS